MPFSILEAINITFNCFCKPKQTEADRLKEEQLKLEQEKKEKLNVRLYEIARKHEIGILPVIDTYQVTNLYPLSNHVHLWNIFIIGKDKIYILASINDFEGFPDTKGILNTNASLILPDTLKEFFDPVWDKTLMGRQLQFYMIYFGRTYFVNTYPFYNEDKVIIGAIMFVRSFEYLRVKDHNMSMLDASADADVKKKLSFDMTRPAAHPGISIMKSALYMPSVNETKHENIPISTQTYPPNESKRDNQFVGNRT